MSGRDCILAAINHEEPTRLPVDFGGRHATMHLKSHQELKKYLNLEGGEEIYRQYWLQTVEVDPRINDILGGDVAAFCTGKPDSWEMDLDSETRTFHDEWGAVYRMPPNGYYYDYHAHPLAEVQSISELDDYEWPDPLEPGRYRGLKKSVEQAFLDGNKAIMVTISPAGSWEHTWTLRGPEQAMMDVVVNRELYEVILDRTVEFQLAQWDRVLDLVGPWIDIAAMSDDLGTQAGPMISPVLYRDLFLPRLKRITSLIHNRCRAKIYIHTDGSVREFLPDLIEAGIEIINPVQTECRNMEPTRLKQDFGSALTFWGAGCDTRVLEFGTPEEVRNQVRNSIMYLGTGGGYVFAPIHNIQPEVPPQNIVALFEAAKEFGRYPIKL